MEYRVDILVCFYDSFFVYKPQFIFLYLLLRLRISILSDYLLKIIVMHYCCFFVSHLFYQVVLVHFILDSFLKFFSLCLDLVLLNIIIDNLLPKLFMLLLCKVRLFICIAKRGLHGLFMHFLEALFPF